MAGEQAAGKTRPAGQLDFRRAGERDSRPSIKEASGPAGRRARKTSGQQAGGPKGRRARRTAV
jgi:hypothetical protein